MSVKVKWYGDRVLNAIERELTRRVRKAAVELAGVVRKNISTSGRGGNRSLPGEFPHADLGSLSRSINHQMLDSTNAEVYVPKQTLAAKYAKGLEIGKVIDAKGKLLSIPVSDKAIRHKRKGGTAPDFPIPLIKIKRAGRRPILAEIRGKGKRKRVIIHYVLASSVRIEPRPYLVPSLNQSRDRIIEIFSEPMPT